MSSIEWWLPALDPQLSQGDIVEHVAFGALAHPPRRLKKGSVKNAVAWFEQDDGEHFLARGDDGLVLVLTHSCELDKPRKKKAVIVAPVRLASSLNEDDRARVFGQQSRSRLILPAIPNRGDAYADLQSLGFVDSRTIDDGQRICSMTPEAIERLHAQIVVFFTRKDLSA